MKNKNVRKALRLLKSRNCNNRLKTPRILKDYYDDEAAHLMIEALKTELDTHVQLEMVKTIRYWLENGHRPDNAVTGLIAANPPRYCNDIDITNGIIQTLCCVGDDPAAIAYIKSHLNSSYVDILRCAVSCLAELGIYCDDMVPLVSSHNETARNAAVRALYKTAGPDAVPKLCRLLCETPYKGIEQLVVQVLMEINRRHLDAHPDALPLYERDTQTQIIEDALCDDSMLNMRAFEAAKDYGMVNYPDVIRGIIFALGNPQADTVQLGQLLRQTDRGSAIRMAREFCGYGVKGRISSGELFGACKETSDNKTLVGSVALMCLRESDGQQTLLNNLYSETKFHRLSIVRLLAAGDSGAVPSLQKCLTRDKDNAVRVAAAKSLGDIGDASAIIDLTQAAIRPCSTTLRDSASTALKKISDQSPEKAAAVLACLAEQLISTEKNDIENAVHLLVYFAGERAIPLLIQLIHKAGNQDACAAAIRALSRFSHPAIPALITRILHDNRPDIAAALKELNVNNAVTAAELIARLAPQKAPAAITKSPTVPGLLKQFGNAKYAPEQMSIMETIGKIGDASVIATLMELCTTACMASSNYLVWL